jgi:hypothetical protein
MRGTDGGGAVLYSTVQEAQLDLTARLIVIPALIARESHMR